MTFTLSGEVLKTTQAPRKGCLFLFVLCLLIHSHRVNSALGQFTLYQPRRKRDVTNTIFHGWLIQVLFNLVAANFVRRGDGHGGFNLKLLVGHS
jgi:hypothetical protein